MTDPLDALYEDKATPASQPEPTPAATPAPTAQPEPQAQPRDESGRFKTKAEEPPKVAEATPAAPVVQSPPAKPSVDPEQFRGYLDERDKRQALERELKTLRERLDQPQPKPVPDIITDPEGYASHLQQQIYLANLGGKFDTSEVLARQSYGDDAVQAAMDWGMEKSDPVRGGSLAFRDQYAGQRHPVDWIVKQYKRDQILTQLGDKDPVEWAKELLAAQTAQPAPQAQQPAPQQSAASTPPQPLPTPSLVTARSAGGAQTIPVGPGSAFDAVIPR